MQCEKCGSDNTQRLEVAFESGTRDIDAVNDSGDATWGTSQSLLAQRAAPPEKMSYRAGGILILFGAFPLLITLATILFNSANIDIGQANILILFELPFVLGGGYMCFRKYQFNTQKWPELYQYWLDSWFCMKCGTTYYHP